MNIISEKYRAALLCDLGKLRAELKEISENPPPQPDPLEAFRQVFREDALAHSSTEKPLI